MTIALFATCCFFAVASAADEFEWAGIFDTPDAEYVWTAQKVNGKYADPAMKFAVLPASSSDAAQLSGLKAQANQLLKSGCVNKTFGSSIYPSTTSCYRLKFDQTLWQSLYTMDTGTHKAIAIFAEHYPTEFEKTAHYLKDNYGGDIEPGAELPAKTAAATSPAYEFEWAGIFSTPEDVYMWTAQKVDGRYADASMKLAVLPAASNTDAELDRLKAAGSQELQSACTDRAFGSTITPSATGCYKLLFNQNLWQSVYRVDTSGHSAVAFFAEHFPTEFEKTAHYLKDDHGDDIEPGAEHPEKEAEAKCVEPEKSKPWGPVIGAAVITNLITLCGVILLVPAITRFTAKYRVFSSALISGFAAGALLACAFFLLLFEATHLVAVGWEKEVDVLWRWGTMILAGFILPTIIHTLTAVVVRGKNSPPEQHDASKNGDQGAEEAGPAEVQPEVLLDAVTRARLVGGVLLGDFFHNLCDGFFIGAAFAGCGDSFGWKVAVATFLHEIPQEWADFSILISPEAGLGPIKALITNFISGMGVLFGALIIVAADVSDADTGLLLAFGGGVYLHVAAVECMPRMYHKELTLLHNFICFGAFILGAVLIGLVLLDHEHCYPTPTCPSTGTSAAEESSGGHAHGHR